MTYVIKEEIVIANVIELGFGGKYPITLVQPQVFIAGVSAHYQFHLSQCVAVVSRK